MENSATENISAAKVISSKKRCFINFLARKRNRKRNQRKKLKKIKDKKKQDRHPLDTTREQNKDNPLVKMASNMWAQNLSSMLSWQKKHQIAYWKSKALSLQYENKVLHDIVKRCFTQNNVQSNRPSSDDNSSSESSDEERMDIKDNEQEVQISEAFIQFIQKNEEFKLEAQKERERLRAERQSESEGDIEKRMETAPTHSHQEDRESRQKKLYGENWKRITGLETAIQMHFDTILDREKPVFWPNIPLNLQFKSE